MNFEESLRFELSQIGGLTFKVFPLFAKEGTIPPYIVYISSEGLADRTLDGFELTKEIDCEIHIVETTYTKMKNLSKLVIEKLQSFNGRVIGDDLLIKEIILDMPLEGYEQEINLYRCVFDFNVKI